MAKLIMFEVRKNKENEKRISLMTVDNFDDFLLKLNPLEKIIHELYSKNLSVSLGFFFSSGIFI